MNGCCGGRACVVQLVPDTAVWYHTGLPAAPIRWVLVKDPSGKFEPQQAFLYTKLDATPEQVLIGFATAGRWKSRLRRCRLHLGIET